MPSCPSYLAKTCCHGEGCRSLAWVDELELCFDYEPIDPYEQQQAE